MSDLILIAGGMGIMVVMAAILAFFDKVGRCNHKWGQWAYKEDSAVFMQKRQCDKCGYLQIEQHRKI